jgi:hypothetical protein
LHHHDKSAAMPFAKTSTASFAAIAPLFNERHKRPDQIPLEIPVDPRAE